MQNPFSTTFSKLPEYTYISTTEPVEMIENFSYEKPSESVYKICGVRGSGKTVTMARVQDVMKSKEMSAEGWLVYNINPARDMLVQMAALLYSEDFIKKSSKSKSISINASVLGTGGGIGYSSEADNRYFDVGVEIKKMLEIAADNKKKILICIDEVSKTPDMTVFALEFGGWLISGYPIHIICTGLYENVLELGNTKNLTFFRRGTTIEVKPLNFIRMTEMYKSRLNIEVELAKKMAEITRGYAYAFQELGSLYYKYGKTEGIDSVVDSLKQELFAYSYEKIWEELSEEDRFLTRLLEQDGIQYKRSDLLIKMGEKANSYSVYRDRLIKKGVISAKQGYVSLALPFFGEYVKEYGVY